MKNVYLTFIVIILLMLITVLVTLTYRYVIYPVLNKPMVHENCTIFWSCKVKNDFFGKIDCYCVYYEKNCANNCKHPEECQSFVHGCSLEE